MSRSRLCASLRNPGSATVSSNAARSAASRSAGTFGVEATLQPIRSGVHEIQDAASLAGQRRSVINGTLLARDGVSVRSGMVRDGAVSQPRRA